MDSGATKTMLAAEFLSPAGGTLREAAAASRLLLLLDPFPALRLRTSSSSPALAPPSAPSRLAASVVEASVGAAGSEASPADFESDGEEDGDEKEKEEDVRAAVARDGSVPAAVDISTISVGVAEHGEVMCWLAELGRIEVTREREAQAGRPHARGEEEAERVDELAVPEPLSAAREQTAADDDEDARGDVHPGASASVFGGLGRWRGC
jgi:hypothetical protein